MGPNAARPVICAEGCNGGSPRREGDGRGPGIGEWLFWNRERGSWPTKLPGK